MPKNLKNKIIDYLVEETSNGSLPPGKQVPTEAILAAKFNASIASAHRAVKELEASGLFYSIPGRGTFVAKVIKNSDINRLKSKQAKKIHIILPQSNQYPMHWREASLIALEQTIKSENHQVAYLNYDANHGTPEQFLALLEEAITDGSKGIIISSKNFIDLLSKSKHFLKDWNIPLYVHCTTGENIPELVCNMVSPSPYVDGVTLGELIAQAGYNKLFFLNNEIFKSERFQKPDSWLQLRIKGIKFGMGIDEISNENHFQVFSSESDYKILCEGMKLQPNREKICVAAINVKTGAKFIDISRKYNLSCPNDYELIAFDDHPDYYSYNITALTAPLDKIGRILGKLVCNGTEYTENNMVWIKIPYELTERKTFSATKGDKP